MFKKKYFSLFILNVFQNKFNKFQFFLLLGALFDINVNENKQIFQYAIEKVNENLLSGEEFQLEGQVADIVYGNEITVSRGLCSLLEVCPFFEYFFKKNANYSKKNS